MFIKSLPCALCFIAATAFAGPCTGTWNIACHAGVTDSISTTGNLKMNNTVVRKNVTVNGRMTAENSTMHNLNVNGETEIENSTVNGSADINGKVELESSVLKNNMHLVGKLEMENSQIQGNLHIVGDLKMKKSVIHGNVNILSDNVLLKRSRIKGDMIFRKTENMWHKRDTLVLKDSMVKGDIVFKNGNGAVKLVGKSKVLGNIIGGKKIRDR